MLFNVCPAIYAFPHFESRTPNVSVFYITEWSFWCSNEFNGGQCEMKLRRLQQASFLPCTVENDKRQLQAQSQSRSNIQIGNIIAWCLFGCSSIVDGYYAHPKREFKICSDVRHVASLEFDRVGRYQSSDLTTDSLRVDRVSRIAAQVMQLRGRELVRAARPRLRRPAGTGLVPS